MYRKLVAASLAVFLTAGAVGCSALSTPTPSSPPPTHQPTVLPTDTPAGTSAWATPTLSPATPTGDLTTTQTVAILAAGFGEQARLFALSAGGATEDRQQDIHPRAIVSREGRWLAEPRDQGSSGAVVVSSLESGTIYTATLASGFDLYGMAFSSDAARLAFLELGSPEAENTSWALVIVSLEDGSTRRFPGTTEPGAGLLPGTPIGWHGDDLLINSFVPFSEAGSEGVWAIALPPDVTPKSLEELDRRQILSGDAYLFAPRLSPGALRLLYLDRDYDYVPDNYAPVGYDLAVNRLRMFDLESEASQLLVEETEGGALGGEVAWSPDGRLGLFAEGRYGNGTFASLTLKTVDETGAVIDVAPVPLPVGGFLVSLNWCVQDKALVVVATREGVHELHVIDVTTGRSSLAMSEDKIDVLGCVAGAEADGAGNASVVHVRAVQTAGPAPGEGSTTWTFHVTVEHPDTGWEDYADGWDVVIPGGRVLKPDPESAFTRTLLHPHVDEQPFTRSQSGIVVPENVTQVRVRAHDIVDGFGGAEVVVDLTRSSGQDFDVKR